MGIIPRFGESLSTMFAYMSSISSLFQMMLSFLYVRAIFCPFDVNHPDSSLQLGVYDGERIHRGVSLPLGAHWNRLYLRSYL